MTRFWVLRFAKKIVSVPLFFTEFEGKVAFTDVLNKAVGWTSYEKAKLYRDTLVAATPDPETRAKLDVDLEVEEHVMGDKMQ